MLDKILKFTKLKTKVFWCKNTLAQYKSSWNTISFSRHLCNFVDSCFMRFQPENCM